MPAILFQVACASSHPVSEGPVQPSPDAVRAEPPERGTGHAQQGHGSHGYHMDFSEVERFARHFDDPDRDAWQRPEHVVELMSLKPGQVVVDLGAGTGYFLAPLANAVGPTGRVLALDVEPNMVEYVRKRALEKGWSNVEARVVLPHDPELAPSSVDRVLVVNTWHHISDRVEYAGRLASSLRPNGAVFVIDFTFDSDIGPPREHRLSPEAVVQELEASGLKAVVLDEELPKQYVVRAER